VRELQATVAGVIAKLDDEGGNLEGTHFRRGLVEGTERVVQRVLNEGELALGVEDRVNLEALVKINGRPALRGVDGSLDSNDPLFGEWGGSLITLPQLPDLTAAVGRIDGDGEHIGTGFVIGDGIVMTNRHVLEAIAEEVRGPAESRWVFNVNNPT